MYEIALDSIEAEGFRRGSEQAQLEIIKNVMDSLQRSAQEAMDILKIPRDEQPLYMEKLHIVGEQNMETRNHTIIEIALDESDDKKLDEMQAIYNRGHGPAMWKTKKEYLEELVREAIYFKWKLLRS